MGYEVHFKGMPNDVMEKYNKNKFYSSPINGEYRIALKVFVLRNPKDGDDPKEIRDAAFQIKLLLSGIQAEIERKEEQFAYDRWKEENGDLWYCGREWMEDTMFYGHRTSNEDVYEYIVEKLVILKYCVESGDFFAENSNFSDKLEEIKSLMEYFEDTIRDNKTREIQKQLAEYRIPDDYDEDEEDANKILGDIASELLDKKEDKEEAKTE